jgi:mannose-6-phosphate isomerase-like protein (cupin superfamily)
VSDPFVMTTGSISRSTPEPPAADAWFAARIVVQATSTHDARTALVEREARGRGVMPPLYVHDEDETFRVLVGEMTFYVGVEVVRATAGDIVVAPRGLARTYRIDSEGARWLVLTHVASVSRFEDFGRALALPMGEERASWPSAEEAQSLAAIAGANGIRVLGPPGMVPTDL